MNVDEYKGRMKIRILLLAANPKNTSNLRLSEEFRDIRESIDLSDHKHDFDVFEGHAVRTKDLRRLILKKSPHIVHYSGHGEVEGICLEDQLGNSNPVDGNALEELFGLFGSINCVVLNSCYSVEQAGSLVKVVPYIIGMKNPIKDQSAIDFSVGFYDAIGSKRSIEDSFVFGCNAISMQSHDEKISRSIDANIHEPKKNTPILLKGDVNRVFPPNEGKFNKGYIIFSISLLVILLAVLIYFNAIPKATKITLVDANVVERKVGTVLVKKKPVDGGGSRVKLNEPDKKYAPIVKNYLWPNGIKIKISFLDGEPKDINYVKNISKEWLKYANLDFDYVEKEEKSDVRISFNVFYAFTGTLGENHSQDEPTIGLAALPGEDDYGNRRRFVLHEIGHMLGLIHEYQTPNALQQINWEKAYKYYRLPPNNWTKESVDENLRMLPALPTSHYLDKPYDPSSVMADKIPIEIMKTPVLFPSTSNLSEGDIDFIRILYPK